MRFPNQIAVILLGIVVVFAGVFFYKNSKASSTPLLIQILQRHYTGTGQVLSVKTTGSSCQVRLKLHKWVSLSAGFSLAEMPQKGQIYTISADAEQCRALEVALASQGDPNDLKSPRHIYFTAGQSASGAWRLTEPPKAPQSCGGL